MNATQLFDDAVVRDGLADHLRECYGVRSGMSMYGLAAASRTPRSLAYSAFQDGNVGSASFQSAKTS